MNLLEKFNQDMITAMKAQDKERLTVLRMVKGAMQLEHINNKKELNEELLIDCVGKQIKMRNDSISEFEKAGRQDLADKTKEEVTDWFNIEVWDKQAEFAGEYIKKGRQVVVDGRISISKWTDQTGEEKERFLVIANNVRLLGSKRDAE